MILSKVDFYIFSLSCSEMISNKIINYVMSNLCFIWNTIPVLSETEELYGLIITQTLKFNKKKFSTKNPPGFGNSAESGRSN